MQWSLFNDIHPTTCLVLQCVFVFANNKLKGASCAGDNMVVCALQEKAAIKADKDAAEAKFKFALVDGRKEQVGCS